MTHTWPEPEPLFPMEPVVLPYAELSPAARLRQKRLLWISRGVHPLANVIPLLHLHPDAPRDKTSPGPRCGTCAHRGSNERGYHKCGLHPSRSAASDLAQWWPACTFYVPEEIP